MNIFRKKKESKRKLKNTHFWRNYRLYLASLRHMAHIEVFDHKLTRKLGVYLRFVSTLHREIILYQKTMGTTEEYVLKLRYCTLVKKILEEHQDIKRKIFSRPKKMLEQYSKAYLSDLEKLKRSKILDEFVKDYVKQNGKKALPKKMKKERKTVELSDEVTSAESEESTEESDSTEEEEDEEKKPDKYAQMKRNCPHTRHVGDVEITKEVMSRKCEICKEDENWLCLSCGGVFCSRYKKGDMAKHAAETGHPIAVSLCDLSFWCFRCKSYIHHDRLVPIYVTLQHYKFGKDVEVTPPVVQEETAPPPPPPPHISIPNKFESLRKMANSPIIKSPAIVDIPQDIFDPDRYLKKVIVSEKIIREFLSLAERHILYKIEFCGMLCGMEVRDHENNNSSKFVVTHCCIPDQAGHSDFVVCYDEHVIHQFQVLNGLIAIGWIHTHPTQSAFLSSMDIYTQFSFQRMMNEFVAIVCAPRRVPALGVFRIKTDQMEKVRELTVSNKKFGKSLIRMKGKLYEDCKHCEIDYKSELGDVVDLRKNKEIRVLQ